MISLNRNSEFPVIGEHQGKMMHQVPEDYLKYIHTQPWLPWRYPEVVDYINKTIKPIDTDLLNRIQQEIIDLFFWKFITYPTTCELIEKLVRSVGAQNVLESGMFSGFCSLHMIRAVYPHGLCTSIDLQDRRILPKGSPWEGICKTDIFYELERLGHFRFLHGSAYLCEDPNVPNIKVVMKELRDRAPYDFVFVDSSHDPPQTLKELKALWDVTEPGCMFTFHDCQDGGAMNQFVTGLVASGHFREGMIIPTCHRMDTWVPCNLGTFIRTDKPI